MRGRFSVISSKAETLRWEMTEKRPRVLKTSLIILSLWQYVYQGFGNATSL